MNSDNNNNNNNINYILYKKIFNNIYLSKLIYSKIKEIHNINRFKSFHGLKRDVLLIYKYNEIPFQIIFKFGLESIFLDKLLKQRLRIQSDEPKDTLLNNFRDFLKRSSKQITNDMLIDFIELNKQFLIKHGNSSSNGLDLFSIFVELRNLQILKYLYNDQKDKIKSEREYYIKWNIERNQMFFDRYGINLDLKPDSNFKDLVVSPYSIYFNYQTIKQAIESSPENDTQIIDFFYEIGIDLKYYNTLIYYWALLQPNRIKIINYLIDDLAIPVPKTYYKKGFDMFFEHLLLLDYPTFKRLIKLGSPVLLKNRSILYRDFIRDNPNQTFEEQLNSMIIGIYSYYIDSGKIEFKLLVKIIKQLIKPKYHNKLTSKSIKKLLESMNDKIVEYNSNQIKLYDQKISEDNNNSIFSSFKKLIGYHKINPSSLKDNSQIVALLKSFDNSSFSSNNFNINYNNFNLEREIKRIYLFQFIYKICIAKEINIFYELVFSFASKYQEYNLLSDYSDYIKNINMVKQLVYSTIITNLDCKLYEYCIHNKILDKSSSSDVLVHINLEHDYTSLLESFKSYDDPLFDQLILSMDRESSQLPNETINLYKNFVDKYYKVNKTTEQN